MAGQGEFDRISIRADEDYQAEKNRNGSLRDEAVTFDAKAGQGARDSVSRPAGAPLPMGITGRPLSGRSEAQGRGGNAAPPGRALSVSPHTETEQSSGMQWLTGVLKQAVPFVQKLLPLLDGQIATAAANLLTARPHPPPPSVDLQPIEHGLADLQIQQANIKDQLADQNAVLKKVEDHLEMVREATDRNTLEQQELIEDLKVISGRMNRLALVFLVLLVVSVLVNISLFLHVKRVLP
jgi:hypothetical protein